MEEAAAAVRIQRMVRGHRVRKRSLEHVARAAAFGKSLRRVAGLQSGKLSAVLLVEAPEPEPEEPTMKQCRCVYEFAGSNEGELATSANDVLGVVTDDGSGWVYKI